MNRFVRSALTLACAAVTGVAPGVSVAAEARDASAIQISRGGGGVNAATLVLALDKAAIIDLPSDARDILLTNPDIADAMIRTPRRVYVLGRKIGQTNIFFFDGAGNQIASVEIRVEPDVSALNDMFRRYAPGANAKAEAVNGSLVLSGTVRSAAEAERVLQIARRFIQANGGSSSSSSQSGGGAAAGGASAGGAGGGGGQSGGSSGQDNIVNLLAVEGQEQVLVKVRIVEMSRSLVRQLGVNLNAEDILNTLLPDDVFVNLATQNGYSIAGNLLGGLSTSGGVANNILLPDSVTYGSLGGLAGSGDQQFGTAGGISPGQAGVGGYSYTAAVTDPATGQVTPASYTFGGATATPESQVEVAIDAFERTGLLRVLAEPNLTAISGEAGRFLAGGEFPVPVQADDGKISVEFKPFGVGLAFTPVVLSAGRISLKLSTEVSELTSEGAFATGDTPYVDASGRQQVIRGITIPALQVRRAETTVEMPSGGAIVIAGLIQERSRQAIEGIPGMKDSPIFGPLFRSRDFLNNESELVIIVTPYLVKATSPDRLKTPADGFRNATERETLLSGRLNALYRPPTGETGERSLQGPHGHVIEGRPVQ
jgi:pilus assembly protein CpaC